MPAVRPPSTSVPTRTATTTLELEMTHSRLRWSSSSSRSVTLNLGASPAEPICARRESTVRPPLPGASPPVRHRPVRHRPWAPEGGILPQVRASFAPLHLAVGLAHVVDRVARCPPAALAGARARPQVQPQRGRAQIELLA